MGSGTPTFAIPTSTFMDVSERRRNGAGYTIVGIPYDMGTSNRPGTRFGPEAIRRASRMLVDGDHPYHGGDLSELNVVDAGDFTGVHGDMLGSLAAFREQAAVYPHLITLGGDHSITLPLLQALRYRVGKPVGLLHFDAHLDTWPDNFGGVNYAHGNPFYHAITQGLIDPRRTVQVGIRSPVHGSVSRWTQEQGTTVMTAFDVHWQPIFNTIGAINTVLGDYPTYLSIDIDVLDPAFAPGTGTPEVGGLATWQMLAILRNLNRKINFVGMDMVEVSPPYDHSEITSLAAATMVWEYLSRMALPITT